MKEDDVVTPHRIDANRPALESPSDGQVLRRVESDTAASTMFTVPCWWSWNAAMLERAQLAGCRSPR
jgi:hypothetical protein